MSQGFNPELSRVSNSTLERFIVGDLSTDLVSVPGVGPRTAELLAEKGIYTAHALIGRFLMFKTSSDQTPQQMCNDFCEWLRESVGARRANPHTIVRAIGTKLETLFPGIYSPGLIETLEAVAEE